MTSMTTSAQGCSGIQFSIKRKCCPVGNNVVVKTWQVVGQLEGSPSQRVFSEQVFYNDAVTEIKRLLDDPKPKPMSEKALDKS